METCPICKTETPEEAFHDSANKKIICPHCGKFKITPHAQIMFENNEDIKNKSWIISYWIRNHQIKDDFISIHTGNIKKIIEETDIPKPREQADNLIRWIGDNTETYNESKEITTIYLAPIIGTKDDEGVLYIIEHLNDTGFLTLTDLSGTLILGLTFEGWDRYEEIKTMGSNTKQAFMAMKYGDTVLEDIYKNKFKIGVEKTGFKLVRLDETLSAGLIDNQLRVQIRNARFLLADLTYNNLGAYWEAGYAEGLGKPVIYLCEKEFFEEFKTHFDTNHHTTIIYDKEHLDKAEEELKATIRATLPLEAKMTDE